MKPSISMHILGKIMTACISSVLFSLSIAFILYTPPATGSEDFLFRSFLGTWLVYLTYSGPVYLVGGIPYSMLADVLLKKLRVSKVVNYGLAIVLYAWGGAMVPFVIVVLLAFDDILG